MANKMSLEEQLEALKKLKELFDAGVLTQEEFDAKKQEILGKSTSETNVNSKPKGSKAKKDKAASNTIVEDPVEANTSTEESFEIPPAPTNARNLANPRKEDFWDKVVRFVKEHWEIDVAVILGLILGAKVRSWFISFHWILYLVVSALLGVGCYFIVIKARDKFFAYRDAADRKALLKEDLNNAKGTCSRIWQWLCHAWKFAVKHKMVVIPVAFAVLLAIIISIGIANEKKTPTVEYPDPTAPEITMPSESVPATAESTVAATNPVTENVEEATVAPIEETEVAPTTPAPTDPPTIEPVQTTPPETQPPLSVNNTVNITLDCESNWFFDKYDLFVWLNGEKHGKLDHGKSKTFKFEIEDGTYTLLLCKDGDDSVKGSVTFTITDNTDISYDVKCNTSEVRVTQTHFENMRPLEAHETKTKHEAKYYIKKDYQEIEKELKAEGYTNIRLVTVRDLEEYEESSVGKVISVSIDGRTEFTPGEIVSKNTEVIISYHDYAMAADEVRAIVDSRIGEPAENILSAMTVTSYTIECYVQGELVENFSPDGYLYEGGYINASSRVAELNFTTQELIDMKANLEAVLPQEIAERVAVVAMTNGQATDVFYADGNTLNPAAFHSYKDISGFYLWAFNNGNWKVVDSQTWHVTDMKFMMSGYTACIKASMDITFDGNNYVVSNVDKIIAAKNKLDSADTSKINEEHLEPSDSNLFLTVSPHLVAEDRDSDAERDRNNKTMPTATRTAWIEDQFSFWNGEHKKLKGLIKANLNDEKSYDHINTTYIDLTYQERVDEINKVLQSSGYSQRVSLGDLFIMCEFSAKNAFNATVKNTAYGIAYFDRGQIELIGVE